MKLYLIFGSLALLNGGLAYLMTMNLYIGLGVGFVFLVFLCFFEVPLCNLYVIKERKRHEAYHFVNNFVISLSVTNSPTSAFSSAKEGQDPSGELIKIIDSLEGGGVEMKLRYLESYFLVSYYPMFVSLFSLHQDQGGDFLKVGEPLLKEATREEEFGNALSKESQKKLFQYVSLWGMSSLILAFLRFGLSGFYPLLIESVPFLITATAYFAIVLLGIFLYSLAYTGLSPFAKKDEGKKERSQTDESPSKSE